ncbi:MAG: 50S ribosomal protein L23 [Dehalococcoidia bacterium]|jgi:large subunit ribosomal protein L23|nr:50S ribosomal protein L23 [Chloroflexota bacterium]MCH2494276.1 50S ribosomal protein L23 [Dehalococcoidia bacterium]MQF84028.1 50S ribosomal protein L23 [SAR202 cluster bacterium]MEC7919449.1 50S ribosomal protein L23 [Chloroflexota bacterium]MEC9107432.1 50S ribosomal protein L23 [Chloroflexota bacterium]|tara:strand:+ start:47 stop:331 length:285 start_codon:yes stop_codon:yes gene_type:complete
MLNEEILISPIITEKSSMLQESNKYVFKVHKNSNKSQIKNAVEEVFDVTVESVNVIKVKGKNKTYGRNRVLTPAWKKAMVTLKLGDSISLYEGA